MKTNDKRKIVVDELLKHLNTADNVKEFSNNLRSLNIIDLKDDKQFERAAELDFSFIPTLITFHQMGILSKITQIQKTIKGE